ncbi:MAG: cobyric acid synthase [Prevotella sp.]|nr:cobyric acid synthase [Prevotella sp.]
MTHRDTHLRPLMLAGTGSDVGKSVIATALCRILRQDGYHPAPFKAQNMALNSFATPEGLEIGRAQAVQAEAAGIPCHTDMNPLLLKPQSDHTSQVVLHGVPLGNRSAYDYWRRGTQGDIDFKKEVQQAFDRLAARYNPIVMEGAGSISELNLRHTDLVNLPMARYAGAAVLLVADIDRGGVFASAYGSIALQQPEDRQLIRGIIINKFRGDLRLFDDGRRMLEEICGVPVVGVVPYFRDIHIEEEDSVALTQKSLQHEHGKVNVAVVILRHISNYTDFDALEHDERVHLFYTNNVDDIRKSDIIILPGTKSTLDDLVELRRNGCAQAIVRACREGATVLGICGGYQMLGMEVCDPDHVEGPIERLPGLALLPVTTRMNGTKVTRQVTCQWGTAYEIHQGDTTPCQGAAEQPLAILSDGRHDGYKASERCMGTYLHGILDNQTFVDMLLDPHKEKIEAGKVPFDYQKYKEEQYDLLAEHVRRYIDMDKIYQILRGDD